MADLLVFGMTTGLAGLYVLLRCRTTRAMRRNARAGWRRVTAVIGERNALLGKLIDALGAAPDIDPALVGGLRRAGRRVASARARDDVGDLGHTESQLRTQVGRALAIADGSPTLSESRRFEQLRSQLALTEEAIADRCALYNDSVSTLNQWLERPTRRTVAGLWPPDIGEVLSFCADSQSRTHLSALSR